MSKEPKTQNKEPNPQISNKTFTIPNILSFIRIILITPFVVFFLDKDYVASVIVIAISGITDFVDGYIARRFHQESELGKILDPLADKLTLIAVGVCLIFIEPFVLPMMIILVIKDLMMLIGGSYIVRNGVIPPKSKWYGKVGTFMFYITVGVIILFEIIGYQNQLISLILLGVTSAMMIFSLVMYARMFLQINAQIKKREEKKTVTAQVTNDQ